jgi:hypothetical protein
MFKAFLSWLDALDWSMVIDVANTETMKRSEEDIAKLQLSITRSEAQIQILVDALVNLSAPAVVQIGGEPSKGRTTIGKLYKYSIRAIRRIRFHFRSKWIQDKSLIPLSGRSKLSL